MIDNKKLLPQRTPRAQSGTRCAPSVLSVSSVVNPFRLPPSAFRLRRQAMSLIEVLISMFVLLFGLMGVAAIFPVGNYYVIEGEKFDLASGIAQNAFEELRARGMLKPEFWYYGSLPPGTLGVNDQRVIQNNTGPLPGAFNLQHPPGATNPAGAGHAFVFDPMSVAAGRAPNPLLPHLDIFPYNIDASGNVVFGNPWNSAPWNLTGGRWPVRRITILDTNGLMSKEVAETIFRLRDDLAVEQPEESDRPSIQRWDLADPNNTPNDLTDDTLLRRQYKGDYSWLATIVPTTGAGLAALQPSNADYGELGYDVSIVVFRKRDETPSAISERLIQAELLLGGELVIYSSNSNNTLAKQEVDDALDGLRTGNWISLMGVNQTTGDFVMKWYRLLTLDSEEETGDINVPSLGPGFNAIGRRAMLIGPDWPAPPSNLTYIPDLRAGILPDVISVVTKPLRMENTSLWDLE